MDEQDSKGMGSYAFAWVLIGTGLIAFVSLAFWPGRRVDAVLLIIHAPLVVAVAAAVELFLKKRAWAGVCLAGAAIIAFAAAAAGITP